MAELRWLLLIGGIVLLVGVLAWTRYRAQHPVPDKPPRETPPPTGSAGVKSRQEAQGDGSEPPRASLPEMVVTLRLVSRDRVGFRGEDLVLALREAGLRHGRYGIFHRHDAGAEDGEPLFSAASLTEPGSFDLSQLRTTSYPGISLFLALPGPADGVVSFDAMVTAARALAAALQGTLLDEQGSTLSIQRERVLREEVIQFDHRHGAGR